jgi:hypothetical protein
VEVGSVERLGDSKRAFPVALASVEMGPLLLTSIAVEVVDLGRTAVLVCFGVLVVSSASDLEVDC